jgi:predicted negative regulator of RcsB-dependent stress response
MKRTERRHLKNDELTQFAATVTEIVDERRREITAIVVAVLLVGGSALGYYLWRDHVQSAAHTALADALAVEEAPVGPPANPDQPDKGLHFATDRAKEQAALTKYKVVADGYPSTDAGIYARYREASAWMTLGSPAEAMTCYQQVIDRAGGDVYGEMARLGLAEAQAQSGQVDQALATYSSITAKKDSQLPMDGILMEMARTYLDAGKTTEAQQTFTRLVQEYPESSFSAEAKQILDSLKKA